MTILSKFFGTQLGWQILTYNCYEVGHTWNPSCIGASSQIVGAAFKESLRIYASLYVLTTLLRTANVKKVKWKRLCWDILRSTLFLTSNAFFFLYVLCLIRRLCGCWIFLNAGFTNGFVASFISILIERKSRRGMLALYLTNLASEVAYRMLVNRNIIHPLRHGETLVFSMALSGYMFLLRKGQLSQAVEGALRFVFAIPRDPNEETKFFGYRLSSFPNAIQSMLNGIRQYFGRHSSCPHNHSCVSIAVEGFLRNFPFAYVVSVALRLATSLPSLVKDPGRVPAVFFSLSALKVPLFVGLLPLLFSSSTCLLRRLTGHDGAVVHAVGGCVAGLAMMSYPSVSIAMYLLWKLIEVVYFKMAEQGLVPHWKHFDVLLYSLSTGFVLFAAVTEPHALRLAYWKFLMGLTDKKINSCTNHYVAVSALHTLQTFPWSAEKITVLYQSGAYSEAISDMVPVDMDKTQGPYNGPCVLLCLISLVNRRLFDAFGFDSSRKFRNFFPVLDPQYTTMNPIFFTFRGV